MAGQLVWIARVGWDLSLHFPGNFSFFVASSKDLIPSDDFLNFPQNQKI
jgi:hypothetical protein